MSVPAVAAQPSRGDVWRRLRSTWLLVEKRFILLEKYHFINRGGGWKHLYPNASSFLFSWMGPLSASLSFSLVLFGRCVFCKEESV